RESREAQVVEADDGDVCRHAAPEFRERAEDADRREVVCREEGCEVGCGQQGARRLVAALLGEPAGLDESGVGLDSECVVRLAVALESLRADSELGRAADMRYPLVAEVEKMRGREPRSQTVVYLDEGNKGGVDVAVEADDGQPVPDEARDALRGKHEPVDEDAVDLLRT